MGKSITDVPPYSVTVIDLAPSQKAWATEVLPVMPAWNDEGVPERLKYLKGCFSVAKALK
jgi:hypothetical protein